MPPAVGSPRWGSISWTRSRRRGRRPAASSARGCSSAPTTIPIREEMTTRAVGGPEQFQNVTVNGRRWPVRNESGTTRSPPSGRTTWIARLPSLKARYSPLRERRSCRCAIRRVDPARCPASRAEPQREVVVPVVRADLVGSGADDVDEVAQPCARVVEDGVASGARPKLRRAARVEADPRAQEGAVPGGREVLGQRHQEADVVRGRRSSPSRASAAPALAADRGR